MIVTRTPYRLSLFGGGTDYNAWFESHGGLVVSSSMQHYCYISVRRLPPFFSEYKTRAVYSSVELVQENEDIEHPSIRGCLSHLGIKEGVEIHHHGDLPARSGIGSSSSFTVGLLNALYALNGRMVSRESLSDQAILVEQDLLSESVGIQDQIMAAHGGLQIIEMGPGKKWSVTPLITTRDYMEELERHLLVGFSGIGRFADDFAKEKIENIKKKSINEELNQMFGIANEGKELIQTQSDMDKIGSLLDRSWRIKRRLSQSLSSEWMDEIYEIGMREGAFGGKLMGAGGGGFFYFLAPPSRHHVIRNALEKINVWIPFSTDYSGSSVIVYNPF